MLLVHHAVQRSSMSLCQLVKWLTTIKHAAQATTKNSSWSVQTRPLHAKRGKEPLLRQSLLVPRAGTGKLSQPGCRVVRRAANMLVSERIRLPRIEQKRLLQRGSITQTVSSTGSVFPHDLLSRR